VGIIDKNLAQRIVKLGYEFGDLIVIKDLRKRIHGNDPKLYYELAAAAPEIKIGVKSLEKLLWQMGFETKRVNDVVPKLTEELRTYFTLDLIDSVLNNGASFPSRTELREGLPNLHIFDQRRHQGYDHFPTFPQLLDSLHPEHPNLSIYVRGKVLYSDFKPEEVRELLLGMYYRGENISYSGLFASDKEPIGRWLQQYSIRHHPDMKQRSLFEDTVARKRDITWAISDLTGLDEDSFSLRKNTYTKIIGNMSEWMVRMVLKASAVLDPIGEYQTEVFNDAFGTPFLDVFPLVVDDDLEPRGVKIEKPGGFMLADAVVLRPDGATQVEVKNFRTPIRKYARDLEHRLCTDEECEWTLYDESRMIDQRAVVLHSSMHTYRMMKKYLPSELPLISPDDFRKSLEMALNMLEKAGYLKVNVHSKQHIMELNEILNERPDQFLRKRHDKLEEFASAFAKGLLKRLQERKPYEEFERVSIYGKKGRIEENEHGTFERFVLTIDDIPDEIYGERIWTKEYVKERMGRLPEYVRFTDVESTGLNGKMVFLIGSSYVKDGVMTYELLFARNPLEEAAMLHEFCSQPDNLHYTYNGVTFDFPTMKKRIVACMLKDNLPGLNIDLLAELRRAKVIRRNEDIETLKLSDVATIFGEIRTDIDSQSVPLQYNNWLTNGKPNAISDIFEHNIIDLINLAAIQLSPDLFEVNFYRKNIDPVGRYNLYTGIRSVGD